MREQTGCIQYHQSYDTRATPSNNQTKRGKKGSELFLFFRPACKPAYGWINERRAAHNMSEVFMEINRMHYSFCSGMCNSMCEQKKMRIILNFNFSLFSHTVSLSLPLLFSPFFCPPIPALFSTVIRSFVRSFAGVFRISVKISPDVVMVRMNKRWFKTSWYVKRYCSSSGSGSRKKSRTGKKLVGVMFFDYFMQTGQLLCSFIRSHSYIHTFAFIYRVLYECICVHVLESDDVFKSFA